MPGWLFSAVLFASAGVSLIIAAKGRKSGSLFPYERRRPAPWQGMDVLLVFVTYVALPACVAILVLTVWDPTEAAREHAKILDVKHPIERLLRESQNGWMVALAVLSAIVVAPLVEEFLFRLLLQGWLETVERRWRRRTPWLRRTIPGTIAVTLSALPFAAVHFRLPEPAESLNELVFRIVVGSVAGLATLALGVWWLRFRAGAALGDLGIEPGKVIQDAKIGLLAFLVAGPPVFAVHVLIRLLVPPTVVTDPAPLFLLALVLGFLYYRTHRIVPAIVLHVLFNLVGVGLIFL